MGVGRHIRRVHRSYARYERHDSSRACAPRDDGRSHANRHRRRADNRVRAVVHSCTARPALLQAPAKSAESIGNARMEDYCPRRKKHWRSMVGVGLCRIAVAVTLLAPLASGSPDGLERVAEDSGFIERAQGAPYAIIADYVVPGIQNEALATILAGIIGVTVVYVLVAGGIYGLFTLCRHRRRESLAHE